MPRAYTQHVIIQWRAFWLTEILGFEINKVSLLLQMSKKTISRYVRKFRMLGHVDTAVIGRPYACIAMHPHEELVIMEVLLQHPEKTLSECTRFRRKQAQNMRVQHFFIICNATTLRERRLVFYNNVVAYMS